MSKEKIIFQMLKKFNLPIKLLMTSAKLLSLVYAEILFLMEKQT